MKLLDILSRIVGYAGIPLATILLMIAIEKDEPEIIPAILGIFGASLWGLSRIRNQRRLKEELHLLEIAVRNDGQLTVVEAALEMRIPIKRIKKRIKTLEKQGVLGTEFTETGEMIYSISNSLDLERKRLLEDYFFESKGE